ncbi:PREDICTED: uncharacterized protein LOC108783188 isoform X2 [Cyphomyrmex costatus]|uniref:uncharacterized protein LOC108783188 isoform X2 n=1 Tax=Cyphomyrmex costatus TaxID=456900 RepID=UPI00085235E4|nr:PREDICTED: uncharacterized protein LOC108783188 isoform X2 [Cyphomyrmex costatus]
MGWCAACGARSTKKNKTLVFPKDPDRRFQMIAAVRALTLNNPNWNPTKTSVICEKHFSSDMWKICIDGTKKLKRNAIPTLCGSIQRTGQQNTILRNQSHVKASIRTTEQQNVVPREDIYVCTYNEDDYVTLTSSDVMPSSSRRGNIDENQEQNSLNYSATSTMIIDNFHDMTDEQDSTAQIMTNSTNTAHEKKITELEEQLRNMTNKYNVAIEENKKLTIRCERAELLYMMSERAKKRMKAEHAAMKERWLKIVRR